MTSSTDEGGTAPAGARQEAEQLDHGDMSLHRQRYTDEAIPLAERALVTCEQTLGPQHLDVAALLDRLAALYHSKGEYASAERLLQRALAIRDKVLGRQHPDVASALNSLAQLYCAQGNYVGAELLFQRVLAIRESAMGSDHPHVASVLQIIASLYRTRGVPVSTVSPFQRALAVRELAVGAEHPDLAASLDNLAAVYQAKVDHSSAEPLFQRALAIREAAYGPEHPDVASSLHGLASLYQSKGEYARAEPLFQRALAIREKVYGREHPELAASLNDLGSLHQDRGDYARAEQLFQRMLAIQEAALGPEHPSAADSLDKLALLYQARGDYTSAEVLLQRALAIREKTLWHEHPDVVTSLNNLALLYRARGGYSRSEALLQRALAIREKTLGPAHPDVAASLNDLASLYQAKGDRARAEPLQERAMTIWDVAATWEHHGATCRAAWLSELAKLFQAKRAYRKAEALFWRALEIRRTSLSREHPDVATSVSHLASVCLAEQNHARAETLYERALAIRERTLGPEHPDVATSVSDLAEMFSAKGDDVRAEPLYQRALAIREKVLAPEHLDVARSVNALAGLYRRRGDYARAEPLYQRALAIREKVLAPEHLDVVKSVVGLAELYCRKGDHVRAEPLYQRALELSEMVLGPEHRDIAQLLLWLAFVRYARGDYTTAASFLQRALRLLERALGPEHRDVATMLNSLAMVHLAQRDCSEAARLMARAAAIEEINADIMLASRPEEKRRSYVDSLRGATNGLVALHIQLSPGAQDASRLALATILRRKGRVLDAMLDSFATMIRCATARERMDGLEGVRRDLADGSRRLLDQLRSASAQLGALTLRRPDAMPITEYRAALTRLDAQRQALEAAVFSRGAELQMTSRQIAMDQVRAAIPEGAALVELFRYHPFNASMVGFNSRASRYVAYVLCRDGEIAWADLGDATAIEAAAERFRCALARPCAYPEQTAREFGEGPYAGSDLRPAARELDRLVMQPVRALLGSVRCILLSPDGVLNLIPFGALIDEQGRYLIERYALTYLASGRDLLRFATTVMSRQGPVVVAAPDYNATVEVDLTADSHHRAERSAEVRAMHFRPLRFAAEEGRAVAARLPDARLLMGADATEVAVKSVGGPLVLHIATHGFLLPDEVASHAPPVSEADGASGGFAGRPPPALPLENPLLRAGVALAGANRHHGGHEDGVLTALELSHVDLIGTKLVVLSACQTGVGKVQSGDGVYGLRRAVAMAGAETQVMSLWSVDDAATSELMQSYYDRLLAAGGRGEALRQAQLAMLSRADLAHPYYWASFIVSGNPAALDGRPVEPSFV